jgi:dihydrofolate reductase
LPPDEFPKPRQSLLEERDPEGGQAMRRFKLQVQTTVDGYMGGPNGEMDWVTWSWSDDMTAYSQALHDPVDLIVLGRRLAEGFIPSWEARRDDPQGETEEAIEFMNSTPRVVVSNSLPESPWKNAVVARGDLGEIIDDLKGRPGGDMIAYGGSTFVQNLIAGGLLDDLYLFVNPAAIGAGLPVFPTLASHQNLDLVEARPFECGVTALHYQPQRA